MSFYEPFRVRVPAWADWFALLAMAVAAPMIALFFDSFWHFFTGFRLYQAEVGGAYFYPGSGGVGPPVSLLVFHFFELCGALAIPTFLVLLPFRKRALVRWIVWAGFIVVWSWFAYQMRAVVR